MDNPLGQFLKDARHSAGLYSREVALKAGVSLASYGGYETGRRLPSVKTLQKILDALEVPGNGGLEGDLWTHPKTRDEVQLSAFPGDNRKFYENHDPIRELRTEIHRLVDVAEDNVLGAVLVLLKL